MQNEPPPPPPPGELPPPTLPAAPAPHDWTAMELTPAGIVQEALALYVSVTAEALDAAKLKATPTMADSREDRCASQRGRPLEGST